MEYVFKTTGVAACGLVTSLLTAVLVAVVEHLTEFNIFTFSIWVVVPAGAMAVGFAAASGYYFGSLFFHTRPNLLLLIQMLVVAGFTQLLIYYIEYATLILDNGQRASELVSFGRYLEVFLTTAHYRIGRGAGVDTGEVGQFGYVLAALEFAGFLVGAVSAFLYLLGHPVCEHCKNYLRMLASSVKFFGDATEITQYHDVLFQLSLDSPEFAQMVALKYKAKKGETKWKLDLAVFGCPACKRQVLNKEVAGWNGKEWKTIDDLTRRAALPQGIDLAGVLRAKS